MQYNYVSRNTATALPVLAAEIMEGGDEVASRNGRTMELTHVGITLQKPLEREVLVPGRKVNLAAQIAETAWILAGRNDVGWLKHYLRRAPDFSDDGVAWRGGYGPRLRSWPVRDGGNDSVIDQIAYVVDTLRGSALSRQAVAMIYDPQIDTQPGKDIPCNNWLSFSSRLGRLDLHVAIRSNDLFWGWSGINAFEWSVVQEVVAGLLGLQVGSLHFSTTSLHIYDQHWGRARDLSTEIPAWPASTSPRFSADAVGGTLDGFDDLLASWFQLESKIRTGTPLSQDEVDGFPEPMLRSWLMVLQWWWSGGDTDYLRPLEGTALWAACDPQFSVQPKRPDTGSQQRTELYVFGQAEPVQVLVDPSPFLEYVTDLHRQKHEAYGDSWKRRGEMLGILANIARKVDRLGGSDTADETSTDTAIDLMVYLAKYRVWLTENGLGYEGIQGTTDYTSDPKWANALLLKVEERLEDVAGEDEAASQREVVAHLEDILRRLFDSLEQDVKADLQSRYLTVDRMLDQAYVLARRRWDHDEWKRANEARMWKGYEQP